jgi:hypothetical protein
MMLSTDTPNIFPPVDYPVPQSTGSGLVTNEMA